MVTVGEWFDLCLYMILVDLYVESAAKLFQNFQYVVLDMVYARALNFFELLWQRARCFGFTGVIPLMMSVELLSGVIFRSSIFSEDLLLLRFSGHCLEISLSKSVVFSLRNKISAYLVSGVASLKNCQGNSLKNILLYSCFSV